MGLPADASGAYRPNPQATAKFAPRPSSLKGYTLPPFTLNHCFGKNASIGRGDSGAIRGSTGREFRFQRQSQKRFRKERRRACGPALNQGKTTALWFRDSRRCPRAPPGAPKYLIPLVFDKSEGGQAKFTKFAGRNLEFQREKPGRESHFILS
jgi:hypothetical protein